MVLPEDKYDPIVDALNRTYLPVALSSASAWVFNLVYDPDTRTVNVFHGAQTPKLRQKSTQGPKSLWHGPVSRAPAGLLAAVQNSQTPKLP